LLLAVLIILIAASAVLLLSPSLKTRGYFAFYRTWHAHWPFAAGKRLPDQLSRVFSPFVPIWVQVEPGITMLLDPYDEVGGTVLAYGTFEKSTMRELMRHMPAGGTVIDVGAHIGWYSLKAASAVGPKGHVIAVEPNHETLVELRANIRASGAGGVIAVAPVACADSETTLTFYAAPRRNTGESSLSATNASQEGAIAASYSVRARRLDDIVKEAGVNRVDAIKIDVEGAEFLVLKGAAETLDRYRPVVVVELVDRQLKAMGSSVAEVEAFLRAHGYPEGRMYEQNMVYLPAVAR
jgi:FkbM family methyltransferase